MTSRFPYFLSSSDTSEIFIAPADFVGSIWGTKALFHQIETHRADWRVSELKKQKAQQTKGTKQKARKKHGQPSRKSTDEKARIAMALWSRLFDRYHAQPVN